MVQYKAGDRVRVLGCLTKFTILAYVTGKNSIKGMYLLKADKPDVNKFHSGKISDEDVIYQVSRSDATPVNVELEDDANDKYWSYELFMWPAND